MNEYDAALIAMSGEGIMNEDMHAAIACMTDDEKQRLKSLWEDNSQEHVYGTPPLRCTIFFPDQYGLKPLDFYGTLPPIGHRIHLDSMNRRFLYDPPKDRSYYYDYKTERWVVTRVDLVLTVWNDLKDQLLCKRNQLRAEIHVRSLYTKWDAFKEKYWWPLRRKVLKLFRR